MIEHNKGKRRREGEILRGKYRLDRYVAAGGMGEVYQATNLALNRVVAVKILLDKFVSNKENLQRFLQEARTASMVQHPNIVQIFDIDETESGAPFIVQEFLRGKTLSQWLRGTGERMTGKQMLDILIPVIEAIGEAHKTGIVHRDIKPSNVFLTKQDHRVIGKVLDFGISRVGTAADDVRLTRTTAVLGSPAYMAPEQIQSARNATTRSDVWSIGVMMYELLAGELPFRGKTSSEVMVNVCSQEPVPLHESAPGISPALEEVVARCLSRRIDERYLNGESVAMALREVREKEFSGRRPEPSRQAMETTSRNPKARAGQTNVIPAVADVTGSLSIDETPSRFSNGETSPRTTSETNSGENEHPSYGDIPSILAGFAVLAGLLVLEAAFSPPAPGEEDIGTHLQIVQLLVAAGVVYLSHWVHSRMSQYSETGATIAVLGLYALAATLALLSGAYFLGENAMLPLLAALLSLSVAFTAFGFTVAGFEYVKYQVVVEKLITLPGVAVGVLTVVALAIGVQYFVTGVG